MAFDAVKRELVMFGGTGLSGNRRDTWSLRHDTPLPLAERCVLADEDLDGDGLAGCADPDCWGRCAPLCPPGTSCGAAAVRCGDGTCTAIEDHALCPTDCP